MAGERADFFRLTSLRLLRSSPISGSGEGYLLDGVLVATFPKLAKISRHKERPPLYIRR